MIFNFIEKVQNKHFYKPNLKLLNYLSGNSSNVDVSKRIGSNSRTDLFPDLIEKKLESRLT